jgi:hypothetical protein
MRYITVILAAMLLAAPAMADVYGITSYTGTGASNGDFCVYQYAIPFTVGASDQIADSGRFWMYDLYETTTIQMAIYEVSGSDTNLVDTTENVAYATNQDQVWNELDFQIGATLSAGGSYILAISGDGDAVIKRWDSTGFTRLYEAVYDYGGWEDPWSGAAAVADMTTALHVYTSDAGGGPPAETGQIIMIKEN